MRTLLQKFLFILFISSSSLLLWLFISNSSHADLRSAAHAPRSTASDKPVKPDTCNNCKEIAIIEKVVSKYSNKWSKQVSNLKKFKLLLSSKCSALSKAIVTQANTPLGSKVNYDGEKSRSLQVTPALFSTFAKESPFGNSTWETCAVVGNGGILANSSCGEMINSASMVIRCNLPPVGNGYEKDVGNKTDLVTANPSILLEKFSGLMERRRPFVESLSPYANAMLLLPAFSYGVNTPVSLRALYTLEDFRVTPRPLFLNPEYLSSLARFWKAQGLRSTRLSTGMIVASLALELCTEVHLYGYWPFGMHPHGDHRSLNNHYYDDRRSKKNVHAMPAEFEHLQQLHGQGVLHLHLGECPPTS